MSFLDATATTILNHYQVTLLLLSEPDTSAVDAVSKKITKHFELHVGLGTRPVSVALIANLAHSYFSLPDPVLVGRDLFTVSRRWSNQLIKLQMLLLFMNEYLRAWMRLCSHLHCGRMLWGFICLALSAGRWWGIFPDKYEYHQCCKWSLNTRAKENLKKKLKLDLVGTPFWSEMDFQHWVALDHLHGRSILSSGFIPNNSFQTSPYSKCLFPWCCINTILTIFREALCNR